jgi:hypothetical protein
MKAGMCWCTVQRSARRERRAASDWAREVLRDERWWAIRSAALAAMGSFPSLLVYRRSCSSWAGRTAIHTLLRLVREKAAAASAGLRGPEFAC